MLKDGRVCPWLALGTNHQKNAEPGTKIFEVIWKFTSSQHHAVNSLYSLVILGMLN